MSVFGWHYPPGCSGPPEPEEMPCTICGGITEECICPECEICGGIGNPDCYRQDETGHGLEITQAQKWQKIASENQFADGDDYYETDSDY